MGPFHSTKTFENLETAANGTEISRNVNHSNSRFSGSKVVIMERKLPGINFRKIGYTSRGCPVFGNFAPSFAPGSCRKFKPNVLVEWKALYASCQKGAWHWQSTQMLQKISVVSVGKKVIPRGMKINEPFHKFPPILSGFLYKWQRS